MKVALLQLNPTVGDFEANAAKIQGAVAEATAKGADLCVTTELALLGYPCRDLLLYPEFVEQSIAAAERLAKKLGGLAPTLVGAVERNASGHGKPLYNAALLLRGGLVERSFRKSLLPTYDVFDEERYFEPGDAPMTFTLNGRQVAVTICEDIWSDKEFEYSNRYDHDPLDRIAGKGVDLTVNLSASPFTLGKQGFRQEILSRAAQRLGSPFIYVNQVGGNDDLVFDGRSMAFDAQGALFARAPGFEEDMVLADLESLRAVRVKDDFSAASETWRALVLGTRDYVRKSGFGSVLLGLSGGIDSALTAAVAAQALGPENVLAVLMPSPFTHQSSLDDARKAAELMKVKTLELPIEQIMNSFDQALADPFAGLARDVTEENIQSRIRGTLLMALSNKLGSMLLATGNKSELSVGYCTIYGDMNGGFAVLSDVPKVLAYKVSRYVNERIRPMIPDEILEKAPTAELRPDQKDEDNLPPYDVLDKILEAHVVERRAAPEIVDSGFDSATVREVLAMVKRAEFKRRQAPPGIKITDRAFGTGWRMPLASRWRLHEPEPEGKE